MNEVEKHTEEEKKNRIYREDKTFVHITKHTTTI